MGTNYYFFTKDKNLVKKYFNDNSSEHELVDEPDFGYRIHLNKLSSGWLPLFQIHKAFKTFSELEDFYSAHKKQLQIIDEYDRSFTWNDYKCTVIDHATYRDPEPCKWVFERDEGVLDDGKPHLRVKRCEPEEAELTMPFRHQEYQRTYVEAAQKCKAYDDCYFPDPNYLEDPDYPFDWMNSWFE